MHNQYSRTAHEVIPELYASVKANQSKQKIK
jgi:hypothetical protein